MPFTSPHISLLLASLPISLTLLTLSSISYQDRGILLGNDKQPSVLIDAPFNKATMTHNDALSNSENLKTLFGQAATTKPLLTPPPPATRLDLQLIATFTHSTTTQGTAVIANRQGSSTLYHIGDQILPGTRLKSVGVGTVDIMRNGTVERLDLPILSDQSRLVNTTVAPVRSISNNASPALSRDSTLATTSTSTKKTDNGNRKQQLLDRLQELRASR